MSDNKENKSMSLEEMDRIFGPIVITPAVNKSRMNILDECCQKMVKCDWDEFVLTHTGEAITHMVYHAMNKYTTNERRLSNQKNKESKDLALFHLEQYKSHCETTVADGNNADKENLEELTKAVDWLKRQ